MPILNYLKSETRSNHKKIETVACMGRLFAADYSMREYQALLEKMYGFYDVTESIILDKIGDELRPGFNLRSKIGLLKQDLIQLGLDERAVGTLPRCMTLSNVDSVASSLGVWYVLEGSTLGGQLISRHLQQHFGDSSLSFMSFHRGYGEQTGSYWKQFCALLEDRVITENANQVQEVTHAAKLTFDALTSWLSEDYPQR